MHPGAVDTMTRRRDPNEPDQGSTLTMVLVLIVIVGLMLVPTMDYVASVLRTNSVVQSRTASAEAAKGGLRVALGDVQGLYSGCASTTPTPVPTPPLAIPTSTTCQLLAEVARYSDSQLPWGVATTWLGSETILGDDFVGTGFVPPAGADERYWRALTAPQRIGSPTAEGFESSRSIWLPTLPSRPSAVRQATGYQMPPDQMNPGYSDCTAYFPGTYTTPITVDGPAYFASGVYYLEAPLIVTDSGEAIFGSGRHFGCTDDQRAAFSAIDGPTLHDITGVGATLVVGGEGRVAIQSTNGGTTSFKMNIRQVADGDTGLVSTSEVSIMTVNGAVLDGGEPTDLDIGGRLSVPVSQQQGAPLASGSGYQPSSLVPETNIPPPPAQVGASPFVGAVTVSWAVPIVTNAISGYTATATPVGGTSPAGTCQAPGFGSSCAITGLDGETSYDIVVVAHSNGTDSDPSVAVVVQPDANGTILTAPQSPTITAVEAYDDALRVTWNPSTDDGGAPVTDFAATVSPVTATDANGTRTLFGGGTCVSDTFANECAIPVTAAEADAISGLDVDVSVAASNVVGSGAAAPQTLAVQRRTAGYVAPSAAPVDPFGADPETSVVSIQSSGAGSVDVDIVGYIAVPQGRLTIHADSTNDSIRADGGVLAAWIDMAVVCDCAVGQRNEATQRVVRVVTRTTDGLATTSDATVQINSNGAWVVNSWTVEVK